MKERTLIITLCCTAGLLVGGGTWLWFKTMEKRWVNQRHTSEAAIKNPMLAAQRWLEQRQRPVEHYRTLANLPWGQLPAGTLLLAGDSGIITPSHSDQLLQWVHQGNTLIMQPGSKNNGKASECGHTNTLTIDPKATQDTDPINSIDGNPIGTFVGVYVERRSSDDEGTNDVAGKSKHQTNPMFVDDKRATPPTACLATWQPPGLDYGIRLNATRHALLSSAQEKPRVMQDATGEALRVYAHGSGHIVMVADHFFRNEQLAHHDHAQLLWSLVQLNRQAPMVLMVNYMGMPRWYQLVWERLHLGIISAACALAALLWLSVRRFGPILPDPTQERRSLLEHIDASGRWLWKTPQGSQQLLAAARAPVLAMLQRKLPRYHALTPADLTQTVAQHTGLPTDNVIRALLSSASTHPAEFTQQIHTLQQLKKHYER